MHINNGFPPEMAKIRSLEYGSLKEGSCKCLMAEFFAVAWQNFFRESQNPFLNIKSQLLYRCSLVQLLRPEDPRVWMS